MTLTQALKQRIANKFSHAAADYDSMAEVQLDIAFDALAQLQGPVASVLDIGCGTGRITSRLQQIAQCVYALDMAQGMLHFARQQYGQDIHWLAGDAESLPLADASVDAVFSSMVLQWCDGLEPCLREIARVLVPGGQAILAVMAQGSLSELHQSWQQIDAAPHVNRFQSLEAMTADCRSSGLDFEIQAKDYVTWHKDIRALLASIKGIGASVVTTRRNAPALTRKTLMALEHNYGQQFSDVRGLPLTYRICFIKLHKKD